MVIGVGLFVVYLFLFIIQLWGCCIRKPKSQDVAPVRPAREDEDVKEERERV